MSKLTIIILMYVGRVGMLTIPLAFKQKETNSSIEYVNAKITVG
jgi:Trk-type K+ transport system membrane component